MTSIFPFLLIQGTPTDKKAENETPDSKEVRASSDSTGASIEHNMHFSMFFFVILINTFSKKKKWIQDTYLNSEEKNETADGRDTNDPSESAEDTSLEKKAISESPDSKESSGSPQSIIVSADHRARRHNLFKCCPFIFGSLFLIQFSPWKKKGAYPRI